VEVNLGFEKSLRRPAHFSRNGARVLLLLPTAVSCSVVLEYDFPGPEHWLQIDVALLRPRVRRFFGLFEQLVELLVENRLA
jgi:hypothetical protein